MNQILVDMIFFKGALFTASLSLFLEFTFREGMIFQSWLKFLSDRWLKKNDPDAKFFGESLKGLTMEKCLEKTEGQYESEYDYKYGHTKWVWFKPLGECVVCMNVWISVLYGVCFAFFAFPIKFLGMVLLSSFLVRYFYGKLM